MDLGLADKTALVTGSTAGIGYAIAVALAREGAVVHMNGRSRDRVEQARTRLLGEVTNATVHLAPGDLSTADGAAQVINAAPDVDIVVHNAGIFGPRPFLEVPDAEWLRFYETNVVSGVRLGRHFVPRMVERDWGRLIFIGSDAAVATHISQLHYSVSKAAALSLARGLAEMTRGSRVTVNTVLPSATLTEGVQNMVDNSGTSVDDFEKRVFGGTLSTSLIQRMALPEEVAHTVVFLASPLASLTNGAAVRVEGGTLRSLG
jgi:3-oxoacyl-[acyl-carrier protein] reductase